MSMRYPGGFIASTPVTAAYPSGVWTQAQAIPYQAQNVWTRDQYWPYTTLLLQGNGTNGAQNNTFLDSSSNNFTITRNGNTTQGSFTPYEQNGYWSNLFPGATGTWLSVPNDAGFQFGTGDFTIEAWIFLTGNTVGDPNGNRGGAICAGVPPTSVSNSFWFQVNGNSTTTGTGLALASWTSGSYADVVSGNFAVTQNTWHHVAATRSGNTTRLFLNGVLQATNTYTGSVTAGTSALTIGYAQTGTSGNFNLPFPGYISNLRIVKGTAVYTANFTPSTAPLTAISGTSLLTCQDNRFRDNSTNNFTVSVTGSPSVQAFQPFPGATTYSGTVLGGSAYFDGSGDYLSVPDSTDFDLNSTFTIDCWYYQPTAGTGGFLGRGGGDGSWSQTNGHEYNFFVLGGTIYWQWNIGNPTTPAQITGTAPPSGQWNHVAIGYNGTTTRVWVNGVSIGSSTTGYTLPTTRNITRVGQLASGEAPYTGFIGQLRIVKGTDVYGVGNTTITVPTSPLTAVTNTKLLLNFTNAGIFDAAVMNDLETVGNAQVSTSVVKYGTGSMAFDGSGDYLRTPDGPNTELGSGDFTLECWVNFNSLPASNGHQATFVSKWATNNASYEFYLYNNAGTQQLYLTYSTNGTASTNLGVNWTPATGVWYHIACVRNGGNLTFWVNGTQQGATQTISGTLFDGSAGIEVGGFVAGSANTVLNGYIDDLRITKGVARYITSFTPPPARMPGQ